MCSKWFFKQVTSKLAGAHEGQTMHSYKATGITPPINHSHNWCVHGEECMNIAISSIDGHVNELPTLPNFPRLCQLSAIILFQSCAAINKFCMYLNFINVSRSSIKLHNLITAHDFASFSVRLLIALNVLSWVWHSPQSVFDVNTPIMRMVYKLTVDFLYKMTSHQMPFSQL